MVTKASMADICGSAQIALSAGNRAFRQSKDGPSARAKPDVPTIEAVTSRALAQV
ncbi:hypothetical protein [Mesorhizobium sp. M2E.F.Ca.ET.209.01.1.1]|uniref:hypothetical protein n=1 Tax=Mesorhizobium sp. M2E.F.Ca.ET.209.01.1.1 TaxID=2500526 RepID=UPI001FED68E0|nr:hypothetical protein [Mesorhizobium sp. M2E.F.Ca.ET.209.01.1.1]